jgi:hypothetical protein
MARRLPAILLAAVAGFLAALAFAKGGITGMTAPSLADQNSPPAAVTSAKGTNAAAAVAPVSRPRTTDDLFWQLVARTRSAAGVDTGEQTGLLKDQLSGLAPEKIIAFERWWRSLDRQLYTWGMWGAAYVIEDGCSDDCFRDFRAYVILLGRDAVNRALRNPDLLAPIVKDSETGDWEGADDVAPDAYSTATGNDFPFDTSDLSGTPRGRPWSENDLPALLHRFPRLAVRFR